jgi:hypothetical protein
MLGQAANAQAIAGPPPTRNYWWRQGAPPMPMIPVWQGVCGLISITGTFRGWGETVRIENQNGYWTLTGSSQQQDVAAQASCVQFSGLNTTAEPVRVFDDVKTVGRVHNASSAGLEDARHPTLGLV